MKLFLIDGHALIFRMYYAFLGRPMVNGKGQDTSIIFGFTKYLLELILKEQPTHVAVSFDPPGGTFRNRMFPAYKANRAETPQLVIDALEPLMKIVGALGIRTLMVQDFEADDVIGTAAKRFASEGLDVYMLTPDKDYGQLVSDHITQCKPGKGGAPNDNFGPAEVCARYGIRSTSQVTDMLAICGDAADNVPGVRGVGEVGAAKLLQKYDSIEDIYAHIDDLSGSLRDKFEAARDHIALSKDLVTIRTDVPLGDVCADDLLRPTSLGQEIYSLVDFYEMRSLLKLISAYVPDAAPVEAPAAEPRIPSPEAVDSGRLMLEIRSAGRVALSFDAGGAIAAVGPHWSRPDDVRGLLSDSSLTVCAFCLKRDCQDFSCRLLDVELMHYILNPESPHDLQTLARKYLGMDVAPAADDSGGDLFGEAVVTDNPTEAVALWYLAQKFEADLEAAGQIALYTDVEAPLEGVLARMEDAGVRIDPSTLRQFADGLRRRMTEREAEVRSLSGVSALNVSSPKQLGDALFDRMRLTPAPHKPSKGNYPTDEETLSAIDHPIIEAILDYRGTRKLLGTYIEPIPSFIRPDGRVHTTFNQALTSTGRLSSSNPNLQNIPVRTDEGREIRKAFCAPQGCVMMSADYSQIELRVMAHCCGDVRMREAFVSGEDIHTAMASRIFGKTPSEVTSDERRAAKTANFGIMYGISSFGLAQRLKCSRKEAADLIDGYFSSFPRIREFIDGTLAAGRRDGYVSTLLGRRRYLPDLNSTNGNLRALAERNAVNAPIQGTAADIIKMAMIRVDRALREEGLASRMVLQIHDELVLEVPVDETGRAQEVLRREMEGVMRLDVPLTVECSYGDNWLEAH